ncbi:hypothetical protein ACH4GK_31900 [Streptomyces rimosus]|uniref:hypothetical protein n=1 Tax=Streptomyces rimosus TaxID=1927 RepID=UPI0004C69E23|nr:hypothetical protein [Streptomyces rimosus]
MPITDRDDVNHLEAARIIALAGRIARREARGKSAADLEARVERILQKAADRETDKALIRRAAHEAARAARFEQKKQKAVDRATKKTGWW